MERKTPFLPGEFYHIFTRGVEKRKIFLDSRDYDRFLAALYIVNQTKSFALGDFLKRNRNISDIYKLDKKDSLVSILSFSLMPNHFHLIVRENIEGGISKFMGRLLTSQSMYFNMKYERSGPLFVRPFRSSHIGDDNYFRHLFSYVHLNCIDLIEPEWKELGLKNKLRAEKFLNYYKYSSYSYHRGSGLEGAKIIDFNELPSFIPRSKLDLDEFIGWRMS